MPQIFSATCKRPSLTWGTAGLLCLRPHLEERLKLKTQKAKVFCFVVFKSLKGLMMNSCSLFRGGGSLFSTLDQAVRVILLKSLVQNQCLFLPPAAAPSPFQFALKVFALVVFFNPGRLHLWMVMNWCSQGNLNFLDKRCFHCLSHQRWHDYLQSVALLTWLLSHCVLSCLSQSWTTGVRSGRETPTSDAVGRTDLLSWEELLSLTLLSAWMTQNASDFCAREREFPSCTENPQIWDVHGHWSQYSTSRSNSAKETIKHMSKIHVQGGSFPLCLWQQKIDDGLNVQLFGIIYLHDVLTQNAMIQNHPFK